MNVTFSEYTNPTWGYELNKAQALKKYVKGKGGYVVLSDESHVNVSVRKKEMLMEVLANYK